MFSLWWLVDLAVTRHENHAEAAARKAAHYEQLAAALPAATGQCKVVPLVLGVRGTVPRASWQALLRICPGQGKGGPSRDSLQAIMRQLAGLASPTSHQPEYIDYLSSGLPTGHCSYISIPENANPCGWLGPVISTRNQRAGNVSSERLDGRQVGAVACPAPSLLVANVADRVM
ncbi:hypothetical protein PAPYR_9546 [Paratrimastix pyriformis]|uniref:Uncharacterized protein n=1 Tax=Paratrimastix pyriformis TaxID=342808 RepID=A0ABQ8UAY3_9EUKA|nr:hypothetical protein PAPYR_9546 [Paratrimastix pyriformis]